MSTVTIARFINDLEKMVQQATMNQALQLIKGQCKDMEEYKRKVGVAEGAAGAVDIARQMLRQMEISEEDEGLPEMPSMTGTGDAAPPPPPKRKPPRKKR